VRIKYADLKEALKRLNVISSRKYGLERAYGKIQLVRFCNDKDMREGCVSVTGYLSKRELYNVLWALIYYARDEKRSGYNGRA